MIGFRSNKTVQQPRKALLAAALGHCRPDGSDFCVRYAYRARPGTNAESG